MARAAIRLVAALSVVCVGGCGTVYNFTGDGNGDARRVYGGVAISADYLNYFARSSIDPDNLSALPVGIVAGSYFLAVDLPLSAFADTLTLPLTIPPALDHWKSGRPWKNERAPTLRVNTSDSWGREAASITPDGTAKSSGPHPDSASLLPDGSPRPAP